MVAEYALYLDASQSYNPRRRNEFELQGVAPPKTALSVITAPTLTLKPLPTHLRTTTVHAMDVKDIDSEERGDEVYLEEEKDSARVNLAEIMAKAPYVCKALSKASKDQRPTTAQMSKSSRTS
ncbi:hypothetical protein L3X38_036838 [Prunus dulcis]|uniref:Uncharacterized protein n=1 Tax=Prunus dulcis TaxID=3755 RepID=A0AAD4V420_PRUDU|nr:hypothetical protein L3X38_036838 [Prunus dulcis]